MKNFEKGMMAISKAGHDKGKLYIILEAEEEYVYLADGKIRTLEHLKKKKKKHIQILYHIPENLKIQIESGQKLRDEHIKRAIKEYSSSN